MPTADIQLVAFDKVRLSPGESALVSLKIPPRQYATLHNASTTHSIYLDDAWNSTTDPIPPQWVAEPLVLNLFVGGQQPFQEVKAPSNILTTNVQLTGQPTPVAQCATQEGVAY